MEITIVCVPFQVDVARWGCALGPQAFLDAGIAEQIELCLSMSWGLRFTILR